MKHLVLLPAIVAALMISIGCEFEKHMTYTQTVDKSHPATQGQPPTNMEDEDDEPLLLLEDPPEDADSKGELKADNSRCHVCHINYSEEPFAVRHARGDVGCQDCHGKSNEHCNDENNTTAPDTMFAKDKINIFCLKRCHGPEDLPRKHHRRVLLGTDSKHKYCTDCHDKHRLEKRQSKWDKNTGELIRDK